jgi:anti-sigma factor RsiW
MITTDSQLKLQALLDGELSASEAAEVNALLVRDAEAKALFDELSHTKTALQGHETKPSLPESREFFWSKIQREIERENRAPVVAPKLPWFAWVQNHFLPVSGVAVLFCVLGLLALNSGGDKSQFAELEMASDDMGSYTYRDQNEGVTMVWLYDRSAESQFTPAQSVVSVKPE